MGSWKNFIESYFVEAKSGFERDDGIESSKRGQDIEEKKSTKWDHKKDGYRHRQIVLRAGCHHLKFITLEKI